MTNTSKTNQKKTNPKRKRAPKVNQIDRTVRAVINATIELLSEVGYRGLTVELISQRSGVARSTIYRHWSNVPDLAIAAFDQAVGRHTSTPDTGHIRSDLIAFYRTIITGLQRSVWGKAMPSLIEASFNDPSFKNLLPKLAKKRRQRARTIITRAIERKQLRGDTNVDWMLDTISGMLYHRLLITRGRLNERGMLEWVIDSALSQYLINPDIEQ